MSGLLTFLLYIIISQDSPSHYIETTPSSLTAQAIELLQNEKKDLALPLLEQAFEISANNEEKKEITSLILEVAPEEYSKRDAYLRYLAKRYKKDKEAAYWMKELGDRAFDKGNFTDARKWYRSALKKAEDQKLIRYKLAWTYWNLKDRNDAFLTFLEVLFEADESLKAQIIRDLAKLWWEMGALPRRTFSEANSLSDTSIALITELLEKTPVAKEPMELHHKLFLQLRGNIQTNSLFLAAVAKGLHFKKNPCFLFNGVLKPDDPLRPESLLRCVKSKTKPHAKILLPYFAMITDRSDERVDWAHAEILTELNQRQEGVLLLLNASDFKTRTAEYKSYAQQSLLALDKSQFEEFYPLVQKDRLENFLKFDTPKELILRLEAIDPDHWIPFEEQMLGKGERPKDFLLRKGAWLANKDDAKEADLKVLFYELLKSPSLSNDERRLKEEYEKLKLRAETILPDKFSNAFLNAYSAWISDLDRWMRNLNTASPDWRIISERFFKEEIQKNISHMMAQIDGLKLSEDLADLKNSFDQKKKALKQDLKRKYSMNEGDQ